MRALLILIAATALAACATGGPTAETAGTAEPVTTQAGQDKEIQFGNREAIATVAPASEEDAPGYWEEEICKREPVTGSRQYTRRCHTRWQWAQMEGAATETMRDIWAQPRGYRD
jgi:ABC-type glycerol-3-phosphate transport system substrate-binding protein